MLPLEIILTKRSSRNAKAMYKGGRGSEGGGNRNYVNAIKIPQMVLYRQRAMGLLSQTEVEQTRFVQDTRFVLVFNLFLVFSLPITMCIPQATGDSQLQCGAKGFGSGHPSRENGPSTMSDICNPGCVGVDVSV